MATDPTFAEPGPPLYLHQLDIKQAFLHGELPAPVYVRGILMALAKELRLDGQKVARSYLEIAASAMAARGMPNTVQVASSCAMVRAPACASDSRPSAPSLPMPVRRMPTAPAPTTRASTARVGRRGCACVCV